MNLKANMMKLQINTEEASEICRKCGGWCCKHFFINAELTDTKLIEYWEKRGIESFEYGGKRHFVITQPCPHIKLDGGCEIYSQRPRVCREFPNGMEASIWSKFCPLAKEILKQRPEPKGYRLLSRRD